MDTIFNILTRTSNRPNGFDKCYNSIINQTYKNINHIVSYDNDKDLDYLNKYDLTKVKVDREFLIKTDTSKVQKSPNFWFSPHNLYLNVLLEHVSDGWIIFLDDDDMLLSDTVIEEINNSLVDEDTMLIWQMRYPNGMILPNNSDYKLKKIRLGGIGGSCFTFHSKWKDVAKWDAYKCGDFRFLEKLSKSIPNKKWIDSPFIQLNNGGGHGKRIDL